MRNNVPDLCGLPLFTALKQDTVAELSAGYRVHKAIRNSIISSDDLAQRLFLLYDGRMKVVRLSCAGEEAVQQCLHPGDIFCPAAMLLARPCCSYAQCLGPCRYLSWPHRLFKRLMASDEQLQQNLLRYLAGQVEEERSRRCLIQCVSVSERVAACIVMRCESAGMSNRKMFSVDLRPLALTARELGIARETLSRTLSGFEQEGVLCSRRGVIQVHSFEALQSLADGEQICCKRACGDGATV